MKNSNAKSGQLYTHTDQSKDLDESVERIRKRLISTGDSPLGPLKEKLEILQGMTEFELGRFLILHGGLNGRLSHKVFYEYPLMSEAERPKHPLEIRLFDQWRWESARERLGIAKGLIEKRMKADMSILSVPCGVMAETLTLDPAKRDACRMVGADLDPESLDLAKKFSQKIGCKGKVEFFLKDAWDHGFDAEFDIILSLGLATYSPSLEVAMQLYSSLYTATKKGGCLMIQSVIPQPPSLIPELQFIPREDIRFCDIIYKEIIQFKLLHMNTPAEIESRLRSVGFKSVEVFSGKYKTTNIAVAEK